MFINKNKLWKNEPVKQELEEKINPRKRKVNHVRLGGEVEWIAPVIRPYTLRIRVKNAAKYIRSLTTDIRPNRADSRGPTSADLVPKSVEPRIVWLNVRCELSKVSRVGARVLDCTEFGSYPVEQKHAMKGTEALSKESMDLIKKLTTEEKDYCLGKPPSKQPHQAKAGRLVMQVKIKSINTTSSSNEASKLPTSHNDVAFHSETSDAYKVCNPSSPNSPLYDMPPPSTPAQKRARRARRDLQLERWRRNEDAISRQERYRRRADRDSEGAMTMKHIQWQEDLVQYFYIIQEPDM